MLANFAKYFSLSLIFLLLIFASTFDDLKFAISNLTPITVEDIKQPGDLSYTQFYEINGPMMYRVDIANQDKSKTATLLWAKEPYNKIVVLSKESNEALNTQNHFQGRLVRCVYLCQPQGMLIEMNGLIDLIQKKMPDYKEKNKLMPTMVLDTAATPLGFLHYVKSHQEIFMTWAVSVLVALGLLIKDFFKNRVQKPSS